MLAYIVAVIALVGQHAGSQTSLEQRDADWQNYLRDLSATEGTRVVFDCTPFTPPSSSREPIGLLGLDILAERTNRRRVDVEGIQVFVRKQPTGAKDSSYSVLELMRVFAGLEPAMLANLCTDGILLSDLSDDQARTVLLALPIEPEDCLRAARSQRLRIALDLSAEYEFQDPATGKMHTGLLLGDRFGKWMLDARKEAGSPSSSEQSRVFSARAPKPPSDGELDFGDGTILTMSEILERASKAFAVSYFIDSRLDRSKYFFSGNFTRERFETTMRHLSYVIPMTEGVPFKDAPDYLESARMISQALAQNATPYNKDGQLASVHRSLQGAELAATSRSFNNIIKGLGLAARDFNVLLKPVVSVAVYLPSDDTNGQVAFRLNLGQLGS
ncbi:MAG: hypothetical protein WD716_11280 [Fimbriimonadaceae bacterium]